MARTNRSRKREKDSVPDYEGLARMIGSRVEAILLTLAKETNDDLPLSSLKLPVRRKGGRVDDDDVLTLAHISKIQPVVTKQATINVSMEEGKQNSTCSTQRERHYNDLPYTIPYQLLRYNTGNIAVVHAYTRKRGLEMTSIQSREKRAKMSEKEKKRRKEQREN